VDGLRHFFKWLVLSGAIGDNPMSGCRFKRYKAVNRAPLTVEEVGRLFKVARSLEEKALLHLCYSCGLRRSEAQGLNRSDVHFREGLLYVRSGKGDRRRVIPMTGEVSKVLEQYYQVQRMGIDQRRYRDEVAFMVNGWGARMRGKAYNERLKGLVSRSGIGKAISLHHLRHSIATHLLQGGMAMCYVQEFLGHAYLSTTQLYAKASKESLLQV
jgi:integrase/recombinase XerD